VAARHPGSVESICAGAGDWDALCRQVWVGARGERGGDLGEQLTACGASSDCRFEVLDRSWGELGTEARVRRCLEVTGELAQDCVRHAVTLAGDVDDATLLSACDGDEPCELQLMRAVPVADLHTRLDRCERFAGDHVADCVRHALDGWLRSGPTAESFEDLAARHLGGDAAGRLLGTAVACFGVGTCDAVVDDAARADCLRAVEVEIAERPEICHSFRTPP